MLSSTSSPLPIDAWSADMKAAIDQICEIGSLTLDTHRKASDRAATVADQWQLAARLEDERVALGRLFDSASQAIVAIEDVRRLMASQDVADGTRHRSMRDCAETIDANLPHIEQAFLTVRQSALDLLRWTQRSGHIADSDLPSRYRASYAKLTSYTPTFKPFLEAMQHELLALSKNEDHHSDVRLLLSALTRYNAVADSARSFVKSVVEPPMELVFHDTETFLSDWQEIAAARQSHLATEFNDCCQLLLYESAEFNRRVQNIRPPLADGMEASLCVLPVDDARILFTVDEDPVFEQLTVTLLRIVDVSDFGRACDSVTRDLYRGLSDD